MSGAPSGPPGPRGSRAGLLRGVLEVLLLLGGFALLFFIVLVALGRFAGLADNLLLQGGATCLAGLAATLVLLRVDGRRSLVEVGLHRPGALRYLARGSAIGVAIVVPVVALAMAGGLRYGQDGGTVVEYLSTGAWTAFVLFFPAAGEEVLLRGYPLTVLADRWGNGAALALTTVAFSALHGANPNVGSLALVNIGLAGLLLGLVRIVTGSLWAAIGVHLGWNFATGFLADLPVSGMSLVDAPLIEVTQPGRNFVTGGAFGVEGGLASTVAIALAIVYVARSRGRKAAE